MKTRWLVENFTKELSYAELVKEIKATGGDVKEINGDFKFDDLIGYNASAPIIFCGSIEMTNIVQRQLWLNAFPIVYCTQQNYLCTKYLSHYGKHLFNDLYAIVSLKELQRNKFLYYGIFGKEALIFIRPDSGQKPFQAQLLDMIDIDRFCENHKDIEHELVVVSSPKNIRGEWRFVVTKNQEIIACSTYRYQGQVTKIPSAPIGATELVNELLKIPYYPDSVFVMDIAEDNDGKYWLLELNSFSSAGMYACNMSKIVSRVDQIVLNDWLEWKNKNSTFVM